MEPHTERICNSTMKHLLLIDDDADLAQITADMLESYDYQVTIAADAEHAYALLEKQQFQLILLDINLPDATGFEVCRELRRLSSIPIIFASARTGEDDKIKGLDLGGDDYLEKPYSLRELLSRVNALMRRVYGAADAPCYRFGSITVDTAKRCVTKNGIAIHMALKEFDVLAYLCAHHDSSISKETLLHDVWGICTEAELSTVAVHIRWLREKLEDDPSHPKWIKTVWGIGYRLDL